MILTETQAAEKALRLRAFRELLANPAWSTEVETRLKAAYQEALDGCTARNKTPLERAEHVQAFHLASELLAFAQTRIEALQAEVREYSTRHANDIRTGSESVL